MLKIYFKSVSWCKSYFIFLCPRTFDVPCTKVFTNIDVKFLPNTSVHISPPTLIHYRQPTYHHVSDTITELAKELAPILYFKINRFMELSRSVFFAGDTSSLGHPSARWRVFAEVNASHFNLETVSKSHALSDTITTSHRDRVLSLLLHTLP